MIDVLEHLQPGVPVYDSTKEAVTEEIVRLRAANKDMTEALIRIVNFAGGEKWDVPPVGLEWDMAIEAARAALSRCRGEAPPPPTEKE